MTDLTSVPTTNLIAELERRSEVLAMTMQAKKEFAHPETDCRDVVLSTPGNELALLGMLSILYHQTAVDVRKAVMHQ